MKKYVMCLYIMLMTILVSSPSAVAVRKTGIRGKVVMVDARYITVDNKTYRFNDKIRVVVTTRSGEHRYEKNGVIRDIRVGDKVYAVVIYDEMMDITLERY